MKKSLYHIFLPLLLGLIIYLLLREPVTQLHQVLNLKRNFSPLPVNLTTNFLLFHLPDMLWAYALTASFLLFTSIKRVIGATLALVLLSTVEIIQANWQVKSIDFPDILCMSISVILAVNIIKK